MAQIKTANLLLFTVLWGILAGCSTPDSVREYIADQSDPFSRKHINYALYSMIRENQTRIYFSLQIPRNEITFAQMGQDFKGSLQIRLQVSKITGSVVLDTSLSISRQLKTYEETQQPVFEKIQVGLPIEAGGFRIEGLVTDEQSKSDYKINSVYTIDPKDYKIQLSSIRFLDSPSPEDISVTKQIPVGPGREAQISFDMGYTDLDSLNARMVLMITRVKSDTVIARPIYGINPIKGSIETRGYKLADPLYQFTLFDSTLTLNSSGTLTFHLPFPDTLKLGTYYATLVVKTPTQTFSSRKEVFHVFPGTHPYIRSLHDAVSVVRYLSTTSEFERIVGGGDSLLKSNFDKFWLQLTEGNPAVAKRKIAQFYQRAEDANRYFSGYKPGWRTDLGMTYIVLGPPVHVDWTPTQLTWYYFYRRIGQNVPLVFTPIRVDDVIVGYTFERFANFEDFWLETRRNWER